MKDKEKLIRIVYYLVVAVMVVIAAVRIFSIGDADVKLLSAEEKNLASFGLYMAYIGLIIVSLLWIANFVIKLVTDPKSQIGAIIGAGVVAIIFFIAKASTPLHFEGVKLAGTESVVTAAESAFSSAGLITMYVVAGLAIVSAIGTGIKTLFE